MTKKTHSLSTYEKRLKEIDKIEKMYNRSYKSPYGIISMIVIIGGSFLLGYKEFAEKILILCIIFGVGLPFLFRIQRAKLKKWSS